MGLFSSPSVKEISKNKNNRVAILLFLAMKSVLLTEMTTSEQLESKCRINHVNVRNDHGGYAKFVEETVGNRAGDALNNMHSSIEW